MIKVLFVHFLRVQLALSCGQSSKLTLTRGPSNLPRSLSSVKEMLDGNYLKAYEDDS